jgi:NitT/TauT family transport system ATP-binding protein
LANNILVLSDICKVYNVKQDELVVLEDINMEIKERELICIMGPTGCGKSTLLKILGGIEKPTLGTITLRDQTFSNGIPREHLRDLGFVFQLDNLLPWREVWRNLTLPLEVFKLKGPAWKSRVDEMLEIVGLLEYRNMFPHELSGGMKQRVGIARALVCDPQILIMDQPFGALDAITRRMLAFETLNIWRKTQKTIVMVTNSVEEALLLSNRVIMLSRLPGKIAYVIENDVPLDERTETIGQNKRYQKLRHDMNLIVRELAAQNAEQER